MIIRRDGRLPGQLPVQLPAQLSRVLVIAILCGLLCSLCFAESEQLTISAAKVAPIAGLAPSVQELSLKHNGVERYFVLHRPLKLRASAPLVIVLHGGTQNMHNIIEGKLTVTRRWLELADRDGFVVIAPNGTNVKTGAASGNAQHWNDCRPSREETKDSDSHADDVGFIKDLVAWAIKEQNVQAKNVFVTGVSNGGMMTYRLALEAPKLFNAYGAVIANMPDPTECFDPTESVNMLIMDGTADKLMPWGGGHIPEGDRGTMLSAERSRDIWLKANGAKLADGKKTVTGRVEKTEFTSKKHSIVFYKVQNGGHNTPSKLYPLPSWVEDMIGSQNHDIEGVDEIWGFFKSHLNR
jgi:polyhydroxybutyrate depolymerase